VHVDGGKDSSKFDGRVDGEIGNELRRGLRRSQLPLRRRVAKSSATVGEPIGLAKEKVEAAGVEGSDMNAKIREDRLAPSGNNAAIGSHADPRDQALSHAVLQAVLDGDYERARRLAEEWRQLQRADGSSRAIERE
jgi:hypothetical protein